MMVRLTMRCGLAGLVLIAALGQARAEELPPPEAFVDALVAVAGEHPGFRPTFAKGLCTEGTFTATPDAAELSTAEVFAGEPVPAVVRLSVGGGNPQASDKGRSLRGMAVRLQPPGGDELHLVMISAPVFLVRDPADLIPFLEARTPDPATGKPDQAKIDAFSQAHPETTAQAAYLKTAPVPASYAHAPFWAVNTFYFVNAAGGRQPARWVVEPVAGVVGLSEEQLATGPDEFLADEFRSRLERGPAEWDVHLQLPEACDPLEDATAVWPETRRTVNVGRLAVTEATPAGEAGSCDAMLFDPMVLPEGIEPSDDPVLQVRSAAYAVSYSRRTAP
jgi:catalase